MHGSFITLSKRPALIFFRVRPGGYHGEKQKKARHFNKQNTHKTICRKHLTNSRGKICWVRCSPVTLTKSEQVFTAAWRVRLHIWLSPTNPKTLAVEIASQLLHGCEVSLLCLEGPAKYEENEWHYLVSLHHKNIKPSPSSASQVADIMSCCIVHNNLHKNFRQTSTQKILLPKFQLHPEATTGRQSAHLHKKFCFLSFCCISRSSNRKTICMYLCFHICYSRALQIKPNSFFQWHVHGNGLPLWSAIYNVTCIHEKPHNTGHLCLACRFYPSRELWRNSKRLHDGHLWTDVLFIIFL